MLWIVLMIRFFLLWLLDSFYSIYLLFFYSFSVLEVILKNMLVIENIVNIESEWKVELKLNFKMVIKISELEVKVSLEK